MKRNLLGLGTLLILGTLLMVAVSCGGGKTAAPTPTPTVSIEAEQIASTLVAIDILDSAGFHDMAKDLAQATEVNPRYAGKVGKVLTVLEAASWPKTMDHEVKDLVAALTALKAALDANDLAAAQAASEAVHDTQHELSEATYGWIGSITGMMSDASQSLQLAFAMKAIDILDSAGFHDMAKDLAQATEVNPRYAGKVGKVLTVLEAASWPKTMDHEVKDLVAALTALKAALDANDLAAAQAASEAVHDTQHELSEAFYAEIR